MQYFCKHQAVNIKKYEVLFPLTQLLHKPSKPEIIYRHRALMSVKNPIFNYI